jgi:[ribosomal protein S5]-alanine N-acetyltransferase
MEAIYHANCSIQISSYPDSRYIRFEQDQNKFPLSSMSSVSLFVNPAEPEHYEQIVDYFVNADVLFLDGMGVDPKLLPSREVWLKTLYENHQKPIEGRNIYYVIWHVGGKPIGHSNINKIIFGQEAYMHLHIWQPATRKQGFGLNLVRRSIPFYFKNFQLKNLYCEPYALNPAPNKALKKLGFEFIKEYETKPGLISFPQPVNRWCLSETQFNILSQNW